MTQLRRQPKRLVAWGMGVLGADRAVLYGALAVATRLAGGPVTAVLTALFLSSDLQGFYFTFASLLALQVFVELGFTQVIVQFSSHEFAHLTLKDKSGVDGHPDALSRLSSLSRLVILWYWRGAVLLWIGLTAGGILFFSSDSASDNVDWLGPWIGVALATAINFCLLPLWSLLQGADHVRAVNFARFITGLVMPPFIWLGIVSGLGLWSLALGQFAALAWNIGYVWQYRHFFRSSLARREGPRIRWREEILPVQWRSAITWISGYFVFELFTPVTFRFNGPSAAGQMGMTISAVMAVSALAASWIIARAPAFGALIAKRQFDEADQLYRKVAVSSFAVAAVLGLAGIGVIAGINALDLEIADRFLPVGTAAMFFAAVVFLQIPASQAVYLRAHRAEPLMVISVIQAILCAITTIGLGQLVGPTGIAAGYLAVTVLFAIPATARLFSRLRHEWHQPLPGDPLPTPGMPSSVH